MEEEEEDLEWPDEDEPGPTANKQHDVSAPGISDITSVQEFKALCAGMASDLESLQAPIPHPKDRGALMRKQAQEMGITQRELAEIRRVCNPAGLVNESSLVPPVAAKPGPDSLQSVQNCRRTAAHLVRCAEKYNSYTNVDHFSDSEEENQPLVPPDEVVLAVDIYDPIKQLRDHRILVLASQKLTEFRDKIVCYNDYISLEDLSDDPSSCDLKKVPTTSKPTNASKSAFIFINNTFYNDMRHGEAEDSSRAIRSWAEEGKRLSKSSLLDHFTSVPMGDTTFNHLKFRLGYPYLYSHHGNCEHLLVIGDMRLFNQNDPRCISSYPRIIYHPRVVKKQCNSCLRDPSWVTCDDEFTPESPCFFCHPCFVKLHYFEDGKKACSFKAYRYAAPELSCIDDY